MKDRMKFEINQSQTMIIWDSDKCGMNDEISISDYLGPARDEIKAIYTSRTTRHRQLAEPKAKLKKK